MRTWWLLLSDGLRLSFLLRPRRVPLDAGLFAYLGIWLIGLCIAAVWHWPLTESPRIFNGYGLQTAATGMLLRLLASAVICALTGRRALFWTVAGWIEAASLPMALVAGALNAAAAEGAYHLAVWAWWLVVVWRGLVLLRLGTALAPRAPLRIIAAAVLALALVVLPWWVLDAQHMWTTDWQAQFEAQNGDDDGEFRQPGELANPEAVMYSLDTQVARALREVQAQRPDRPDLYLVVFGGDASENVFRNEVDYAERLFAQRFDAAGRTLGLLNHPDSVGTRPLATATNLERALIGIGERMDVTQDILFLYLTSHGGPDHSLLVNQPPLPLDQITPARLRAALDASGIRWRVLVVSACYSGGYVDALRDPQTLVITAARADRTSFGCGAESDITWFGKAYLTDALNQTSDFVQAFELARTQVAQWEDGEEYEPSEPQIDVGERIGAQLRRWSEHAVMGAPLEFVAPVDAVVTSDDVDSDDAAPERDDGATANGDTADSTPLSD